MKLGKIAFSAVVKITRRGPTKYLIQRVDTGEILASKKQVIFSTDPSDFLRFGSYSKAYTHLMKRKDLLYIQVAEERAALAYDLIVAALQRCKVIIGQSLGKP